jgi:hypothetical protein
MKSPSRGVIGRPRARPVSFTEPPEAAFARVVAYGERGLTPARLTIGLWGAITGGDDSQRLFPGFRWTPADLDALPPAVRQAAEGLLAWAATPGAALLHIQFAQAQVIDALALLRRNSPWGRTCAPKVDRLRKRYPVKPQRGAGPRYNLVKIVETRILEELVGLPLNERAIQLVRSFKPAAIEIANAEDLRAARPEPGTITVLVQNDGYSIHSIELAITVSLPKPKTSEQMEGVLMDYRETGTGDLIWALADGTNPADDALYEILKGDLLTVLDQLGHEIWSGVISYGRDARRRPLCSRSGQPSVRGASVPWTQRGFKPKDWAHFFMRPGHDRLRAVLLPGPANPKLLRGAWRVRR